MLALVSHFTGMIDPHIVINTIALISSACWFLKLSAMAHSALEGRKLYPSKKKKPPAKIWISAPPQSNLSSPTPPNRKHTSLVTTMHRTKTYTVSSSILAWTKTSPELDRPHSHSQDAQNASILIDPRCSWALIGPAVWSHVLRYRPCLLLYRVKTQCGHFDG